MDNATIMGKLEEVFKDFFGDDITISADTVKDDIEDWDSVAHIQLIYDIEDTFDIQFPADDIHKMVSIKALADAVSQMVDA